MVENIIYYFSGTGNSLDVARHIAEQLGDTILISMRENSYEVRQKSSKRVGFVYPVYYGGMPQMVEKFIRRIRMTDNIYVFAVATCKGRPGNAIKQINRLFQSVEYHLSYGAWIKTVDNNIIELDDKQNTVKRLANSYVQLKSVIESIQSFEVNHQMLMNPCTSVYHRMKLSTATKRVKYFKITDACNRCGICSLVCPADNIELVDGKPLFRHRCEACMACIQYCPTRALNYKNCTKRKERYHHPNIKPEDLFHR